MPDDPIAPLVDAYEAARAKFQRLDRVHEREEWGATEYRWVDCSLDLMEALPRDGSWYTHSSSGRRYRAVDLHGRGLRIMVREPGDDRP